MYELTMGMSFAYDLLNDAVSSNMKSWRDWGVNVRENIKMVMLQIVALIALTKIMQALNVPGNVIGSIVSFGGRLFGGYQSPAGDMFAYKEGLDFGKYFVSGVNEQLSGMAATIPSQSKREALVIYAEPGIIVKKMANMDLISKSTFHRDVIKKAEALER
jgi:hypothetical protein